MSPSLKVQGRPRCGLCVGSRSLDSLALKGSRVWYPVVKSLGDKRCERLVLCTELDGARGGVSLLTSGI